MIFNKQSKIDNHFEIKAMLNEVSESSIHALVTLRW